MKYFSFNYFRLIARDSKLVSSTVTQVTIVECPACVNGNCDHATAERQPGATNAYYKNASCTCNMGWSGQYMLVFESVISLKLLDQGPFCGVADNLCFGLHVTVPMDFRARVVPSLQSYLPVVDLRVTTCATPAFSTNRGVYCEHAMCSSLFS